MEVFPKRKELASLKQLFVLHGKISIFLHAPPLNAETNQAKKNNIASLVVVCVVFGYCSKTFTKTSEAMLHLKCPASLFERKAEVLFGALKTKSCLSEASSFCLA